ncbi:MAG: hypothetical protein EHM64_15020 [Ignavibacteriae bacterium]|nr:MAG: hypothetical protein EHM64_15020 [Ignavibacteriota bacterium]
MFRLFIFMLVRFFVVACAIYLALTLLKKIIILLKERSHPAARPPHQEERQKPKEEYNNVKDAKFTELPNDRSEENSP